MPRGKSKSSSKKRGTKESSHRSAGGSATDGGINFQAAVTTLAVIHAARGRPLGWLDGIFDDVPVCVLAETGGSGDDIQIRYSDGSIAEAQIKRGLTATKRLWDPLFKLSAAIRAGSIQFGLLIVCPNSSRSITSGLQLDIRRLGDGRRDQLTSLGEEFVAKLEAQGFDAETVCRQLRIVVQHCLESDNASIKAAHAEIEHLLQDQTATARAWDRLYRDACGLIEKRGRRTVVSAIQVLTSSGIELSRDHQDNPASLIKRLCDWTLSTTDHFSIVGAPSPLSIDIDFIPINVAVADMSREADDDLLTALNRYHGLAEKDSSSARQTLIDPDSLGRFYRQCVVIGGPGMGKSILLKRLARGYAKKSIPVLLVKLTAVAARMRQQGSSFEEALFTFGLDASPISVDSAIRWQIANWTILCDGLDECGAAQDIIIDGLKKFAVGHSQSRIVITTRPVGYNAALLSDWRHYDLLPLDSSAASRNLARLICGIVDDKNSAETLAARFAEETISKNKAGTLISRSPLLLGMASMLAINSVDVGTGKAALYHRFFDLIGSLPNTRRHSTGLASPVLVHFLDSVGWEVLSNPLLPVTSIVKHCAIRLAADMNWPTLRAESVAVECLQYWQDIGLVEKVTHGMGDARTFVHKTFAEYAAARHLQLMSSDKQASAVAQMVRNPAWFEVLSFAASGGLGDLILRHMLDTPQSAVPEAETVKSCLAILKEIENHPSDEVRQEVIRRAFEFVTGDHSSDAYSIGLLLAEVSDRFYADTREQAKTLLEAPHRWTRLAAWACLIESGPEFYDLERLKNYIADLITHSSAPLRGSLTGGIVLDDSRFSLVHHFILASTREILTHDSAGAADAFLPGILSDQRLHTMGFMQQLQDLLKEYGKDYPVHEGYNFSSAFSGLNAKAFGDAWKQFFVGFASILSELGSPETIDVREVDEPPFTLSAFITATGFWELPTSDVWAWSKAYDRDAIKEVLRGGVVAAGLSLNDVAREARVFLRRHSQSDEEHFKISDCFLHVDTPAIVWSKLAGCLDLELVELALHFRCEWTTQMAANLLAEAGDRSKLPLVVSRLLEDGRGLTLWAASQLALVLPSSAPQLLLKRLNGSLVGGCKYIVSTLLELDIRLSDELLAAMRRCLLSKDAELALMAARLADKYAAVESPAALSALIREAYSFWQANEEPYPVDGGAVPTSPRATLLSAAAKIASVSDNDLLGYASDSRYDVREVANEMIFSRLLASTTFQADFLSRITNDVLSSSLLRTAMSKDITFTEASIRTVIDMFGHRSAAIRFSAMNVLDVKYMTPNDILLHCNALILDPEQEIRDRAYRIRAIVQRNAMAA